MDQNIALEIARQGMIVGLMVALPLLLVSLIMGILISIFQAVTQVQEITLTFVPKLIGLILTFLILGNWMLTELISFLHVCFDYMTQISQ